MAKNDIHSLIEGYFDATLSEQEEAKLKQMLAETDDDSDDIREAKATMGLFATERYFTEKAPATKKPPRSASSPRCARCSAICSKSSTSLPTSRRSSTCPSAMTARSSALRSTKSLSCWT